MERWVDLAMVAHELGGALAPTRNALQLLDGASGLAPEQTRLLAIAGRGLARAERVLQNLSSIAWLEDADLRLESTDIGAVLRELVEESTVESQARVIRVQLTLDRGLGAIPTARFAFEQVLVNLLSNAFKFTPATGAIEISAQPVQGAVLPGRMLLLAGGFGFKPAFVKVRVADNGVGLSDATRRRLFQPFCRGSEATGVPGMGLGLAVSQRLARRMGGDLRAETPARGASFVLTLPADSPTLEFIGRVDRIVHEWSQRLALVPCSLAVIRLDAGCSEATVALESGLRQSARDESCRVVALADETWVAWSVAELRTFAPALAASLRSVLGAGASAKLRLALRRVPRGAAADPVLLQAAVRCKHGVAALERKREVLHGQNSGR
ncbi:MAG TPA: HAMP domain-containing sensor histidine kinase [Candidatus Krumholzibacteria bacterium]|nr:HAMP domain-containing sensor histidine kinase [Candidatus Krumholzibacteria bacterium]